MSLVIIGGIFSWVVNLAIGLFVFANNPKSKLHRWFAFFNISIGSWSLGSFLLNAIPDRNIALGVLRLSYIFAVLILPSYLNFIYSAINEKPGKKTMRAVWIVSAIFIIALPTKFFIQGTYVLPKDGLLISSPGIVYYVYTFVFSVIGVYGLVLLFKAIKKNRSSIKSNQLKYILVAYFFALAAGLNYFMSVFRVLKSYPIDDYILLIPFSILAYTIIRYRLMDIRIYMSRAMVLVSMTIVAILLALGTTSLCRIFLKQKIGESWVYMPILISMILAAIAYALSKVLINRIDEKRLERFRSAQQDLEISGRGMIEINDVKKLAQIIPRYLTMFYYSKLGVKISHATIFVLDSSRKQYVLESSSGEERHVKGNAILMDNPLCGWFTDKRRLILEKHIAKPRDIDVLRLDDIDYWMVNSRMLSVHSAMYTFLKDLKREMEHIRSIICVPSFFKEDLIGFLLLGNKSHGMYTEEELDLFSRLATNAAAAFRSAQLSELIREFEKEKAKAEKLIAMGELLGSLRHEMFNILTKIATPIQMMQMGVYKDNPEKEKKILDDIVEEIFLGKTILGYVDEYKAKSASDEIKDYNLREAIDEAVSCSSGLMEKWNIKISADIDPRILIKGKETFPDIFKHLMINSCYGMENNGGEITYTARIIEEKGVVEIIQSDTGHDLIKEIEGKKTMGGELFAEQGKVGGINLFLARKIIQDHGGLFEIQPNDNNGARFIVKLPLDSTQKIV